MSYNFLVDLYRNLTNLLHTHFCIICSSNFFFFLKSLGFLEPYFQSLFRILKFELDVLCMLKKSKFLSFFFFVNFVVVILFVLSCFTFVQNYNNHLQNLIVVNNILNCMLFNLSDVLISKRN